MPAFEGLRLIRRALAETPNAPIEEIVLALKVTEADAAALDFDASIELHEFVEQCDVESGDFYRTCIRGVVLSRFPVWVKTMRYGRQNLAAKLRDSDRDSLSVFEGSGLLATPPSPDVVKWWDLVANEVKLAVDLEFMEQARDAELRTIEYERARLKKLGVEAEPEWKGFDDNTAGYDVLSYEPGQPLINKLIEVKSTRATPIKFKLTRNEWRNALKYKDSYFFYIWDVRKDPPVLHVRTVAQVEPHIPTDNAKGEWANVDIPLGAAN